MNEEDAISLILSYLREENIGPYTNYGYDVCLVNVIRFFCDKNNISNDRDQSKKIDELFPIFVDAAWGLCRRGIIRPGVRTFGLQSTREGNAGDGYSLTSFGKQWLDDGNEEFFIPTEPGRFSLMISPYAIRYTHGFFERAQEAVKCYSAHAYLACCAMCGAAAESILISLAIAKMQDEEAVFKKYRTKNGRSNLENILLANNNGYIQREFRGLSTLINYWRDEASHGAPSTISDNEAYTSLGMLLRFCQFIDSNWAIFISE